MSIHETEEQTAHRLNDVSRLMLAGLAEIPKEEMESVIVTALKRYLDDDQHWKHIKFAAVDSAIEARIAELADTQEYKDLIEERAHSLLKSQIYACKLTSNTRGY